MDMPKQSKEGRPFQSKGKNRRSSGSEYGGYMDGRCLAHLLLTLIMTMNIVNILRIRQALFRFAHFTVREVKAPRD